MDVTNYQKSFGKPKYVYENRFLECTFIVICTLLAVMGVILAISGVVILMKTFSFNLSFNVMELAKLSFGGDFLITMMAPGAKMLGLICCAAAIVQTVLMFFGCLIMMRKFKSAHLLKIFSVICFLLIILQIFIAVYVGFCIFQLENKDWLKKKLLDVISMYSGKLDFNTFFLDHTQVKMSCCGITDKDNYNTSLWFILENRKVGVPFSCCQLASSERVRNFTFANRILTMKDLLDPTCPNEPTGKAFTTLPCFSKIKSAQYSSDGIVIAATLFSITLLVCVTCMSNSTMRRIKRPSSPKKKKNEGSSSTA